MYNTHVQYTCTINMYNTHVQYTCTIHMYNTHEIFIYMLQTFDFVILHAIVIISTKQTKQTTRMLA